MPKNAAVVSYGYKSLHVNFSGEANVGYLSIGPMLFVEHISSRIPRFDNGLELIEKRWSNSRYV